MGQRKERNALQDLSATQYRWSLQKRALRLRAGSKKGHSYKPLRTQFQHGGFDYRQIYREGDFAVYQQISKGKEQSAAFEVICIRRRHGFEISDRWVEPAEVYPCSEKWGELAWTVPNKEGAFRKLREINKFQRKRIGEIR